MLQPLSAPIDARPLVLGSLDPSSIRPLSASVVPNTHPEYLAEGILKGVGAISQGFLTAQKAKRDQDIESAKNKRDFAEKVAIAKIQHPTYGQTEALKDAQIQETKLRTAKLQQELTEGIKSRVPKELTAPSIRNVTPTIKSGEPTTDSVTPATDIQQKSVEPVGSGGQNLRYLRDVQPKIQTGSKPIGMNLLNISYDPQYLTTSAVSPNVPLNPATPNEDYPLPLQAIDPKQVLSAAQQFGQQAVPVQQEMQQLLASTPPVQAAPQVAPQIIPQAVTAQPQAIPAAPVAPPAVAPTAPATPTTQPPNQGVTPIPEFDRVLGVEKMMPEQDALDARDYFISKGVLAPQVVQSEKNPLNYKLIWPSPAQQLQIKENEQREKDKLQIHADAQESKFAKIKQGNQRAFRTDKPVMNYLAQNSPRSMLAPFLSAYESAKKFPSAAGAADVAMMDAYGRAESGGRITEGQARLIQEALSLKDKAIAKYGKLYTGQFLTPNVRDQMLRELTENVNISADMANKTVSAYKKEMEAGGFPHQKIGLNYFLGGHTPETQFMLKDDASAKIEFNTKEIEKLTEQTKTANPEAAAMNIKKIDALMKESKILHKRLEDEVDTDSSLLGAKEMRDINRLEGWGGGDVNVTEMATP